MALIDDGPRSATVVA
jgi:CRP/FNR family cyclic AMP-dependent transcriptional regulator